MSSFGVSLGNKRRRGGYTPKGEKAVNHCYKCFCSYVLIPTDDSGSRRHCQCLSWYCVVDTFWGEKDPYSAIAQWSIGFKFLTHVFSKKYWSYIKTLTKYYKNEIKKH